jgi:transcriptional regulator with XRE-family HTH domain
MPFAEKLRTTRIALNLSQIELAHMSGISERTIYNYEQTDTYPKPHILKKLADALNVSVSYLIADEETSKQVDIDQEKFLSKAKKDFGYKGAKQAREVLESAAALFAGGDLDEEAKEVFFKSLMEVYLASKAEAREKYSSRRRISRKYSLSR